MSKKGAKAAPKEVSSYEIRDIVLAKVRGYPPWPGMVVNPDAVPPAVARERPTNKKATFYCVQFFPTGDYGWLVAKDISKLQTHEIESYINEPFKKSPDLLQGYRIALDPRQWEEDRHAANHEAVEEEANAEIDQLESENEQDESKKQAKTKKRKRESAAASVTSVGKTKKAAKPKRGTAEPVKRRGSTVKSKKNGTKSKALVESEDEGDEAEAEADDEDVGPSKKASPPPVKRARRDKEDDGDDGKLHDDPEALKVREWRHRLQKAFLSKAIPKDDDMPTLHGLFETVENYDKISVAYLQFSKIGKVMRHITVLSADKIPRDDEFKFRDRAGALVDRWHQVLNANKSNGSENGGANGTAARIDNDEKEEVAVATAAIDLNGNTGDVSLAGDTSLLADVTMSEA